MKIKVFIASMLLGLSAFSALAQGYKDGIEFYNVEDYTNAEELLQRNLNAAGTDKALSYYYLGQINLHYGRWSKDTSAKTKYLADAKSYFDKGIAANPACAYNYVGLGGMALLKGDLKGAEAQFKLAEKNAKKDSGVASAIAREYYDANPTTYAKQIAKYIETAGKWNKNDATRFILQGDMEADKSQWSKSAEFYEQALYFDNDNIEAQIKNAKTYRTVNPGYTTQLLEGLLQQHPTSAIVQRQLAENYTTNRAYDKAINIYSTLVENPNHFVQDEVRYTNLLLFNNRAEDALASARALDAKSDDGSNGKFIANRFIFYSLAQLQRWDEAVAAGKKFFDLSATSTDYIERDYSTYCNVLTSAGNTAEALSTLKNAVEIFPENVDFKRMLGNSYYSNDNYDAAIETLLPLATGDKANYSDFYSLGRCYFWKANSQEGEAKDASIRSAVQWFDRAIELDGTNINALYFKARTLKAKYGTQMNIEAFNAFNDAVNLADSKVREGSDKNKYKSVYIDGYNYMGLYYLQQGDKANAKMYLQKQLDFDPEASRMERVACYRK